ncbi:MAG: RNA chaperone Hfq, partial [Oscillospiraceae bacterium]|nr:RNA chaperone Hfq [Oscillospiraceae bacterium]
MHISTALQDEMLDEITEQKIPVTVFLMNGFQIRGMIMDHDDAVLVLEADGKQQIVYKHAVSTIIPF